MRANEIIRSIIDLIDQIDHGGTPSVSIAINSTPIEPPQVAPKELVATPVIVAGPTELEADEFQDDIRRFKQIVDLAGDNDTGTMSPFSNAPNESYADIEAVTTDAGGGVNNPKHPSDMRVQHPSLYPGHQHNVGE